MGAQLDQILSYLDKEGVTEVMIGIGQPASLRRRGQLIRITSTAVTRKQLDVLIQGTGLERLLPERDGVAPRADLEIGSRMVRVLVTRRGEELILRLEKSPPGTEAPPPPQLELDERDLPRRGARPSKAPSNRVRGASRAPELRARTRTGSKPPGEARTRSRTRLPNLTPPAGLDVEALHARPASPPSNTTTFAGLLALAIERGATDLHIASGRLTSVRVLGDLVPIEPGEPACTHAEVEALLLPLLEPAQAARLAEVGYVDLALAAPAGGRLRTNISRVAGGLKGTFRIARSEPATLEALGLPGELAKVVHHHQGLVVIAGPSGHGKTTTLSALVDLVNATRPHHIITVEDPIEIVYPRKAAVVSQREVGPHTRSFAAALKGSLREDPDVIVIGELRDVETVEIALTAAETGHLVLATMSTPSAAKTIDRLVDMFPPEDQQQVRASIAGALRAIVSQRLLPRTDGRGVVAAIELVTGVLPLAAMIRDDKLYQLPSLLQRGKAFGMIRMDDTLVEMVRAGRITAEVAIAASDNKRELAAMLRGGAVEEPPAGKTSRIASFFGKKDK